MKIGIMTPQSLPVVGGLQTVVDALARQLQYAGHQVRLFTPIPTDGQFPYPITEIKGLPPFYPIPPENMSVLESGLEKFLDREYHQNTFDLLHAHMIYPTGFCALEWGKRRGVPVVITSHGIDVIGRPEDHYGFLIYQHLAKKVSQCLHQAPALTIVSHHLKKHLLKLGASEDAIHIIPNGVYPDDYNNTIDHSGPSYILAMGSLHRIKGFDLLLEAFALALEKEPGINLTIAGEGPDKAGLIEKSLRMNLNVRFLHFLREEEKTRYLSGCRFLVCPSRYESFGMVALEANAAGKPVLAFDVGGLSELIHQEENGLLVPADDLVGLGTNMVKLWRRDISFSKTSLIEAAHNYEWKTVTRKYLSLYDGLVKSRHSCESRNPSLF